MPGSTESANSSARVQNLRLTEDDPQADQIISVELEKYVAGDQTMDQAIANMAANLQSQIGQTDPAA